MRVASDTFYEWCDDFAKMTCADPSYVPSMEEVEFLRGYTEKLRTEEIPAVEKKTGRPLKSDAQQFLFVRRSPQGTPYVSEEDFFKYLVFISEKAEPEDKEGKTRLSELNKYLRENLILIEDEDEQDD